jgi:hypothetical protein
MNQSQFINKFEIVSGTQHEVQYRLNEIEDTLNELQGESLTYLGQSLTGNGEYLTITVKIRKRR